MKKFLSIFFALLLMVPLVLPTIKADTILTVDEAIQRFKDVGKTGAIVEGYIVGFTTGVSTYTKDPAKFGDTNIAIASSPSEVDPAKIMPVQLPTGDIRKVVNLKDHPENVGKKIRLTGTLDLYFSNPGMKSVTAYQFGDIVQNEVEMVKATPGAGTVAVGTKVSLSTATAGATIYYTLDGTTPTVNSPVYSTPITIEKNIVVKAFAVKDGLAASKISEFSFLIENIAPVRIHDIQGATHTSPYKGKKVSKVEGVVTATDANGFYMQDLQPDKDPATSEGIYVFQKQPTVKQGDVVAVDGQVDEFVGPGFSEKMQTDLASTQIKATLTEVKESNHALPAPVVLGKNGVKIPDQIVDNDAFAIFDPSEDAIDFYESLEGMLVELQDAKVAGPQKNGDVFVTVENNTDKIRTRAGTPVLTATDFNPERLSVKAGKTFITKAGDTFKGSIVGIVGYDYTNYRIIPVGALPPLQDGKLQRQRTTIRPAMDKVTVATFNLENYSANPKETSDDKVHGLAAAILDSMNIPDVIVVEEMQDNNGSINDGTTDASQSAKRLIDEIHAYQGPIYKYIDFAPENNHDGGAPGANIRVGMFYNPARVDLVKANDPTKVLAQNPTRIGGDLPLFEDTRKSMAAEFKFRGQNFVVVGNHLNSKIGDAAPFGKIQPLVFQSETKRIALAQEVNRFMQTILTKKKDTVIVAAGDMNDYEFAKPMQAFKGTILTNMMESLPKANRYTYVHDGNAQVLDNMLVTKNAEPYTIVEPIHINAEFMEEHGRVSDHDPVLLQVDLKKMQKDKQAS